MLKRARRVMGIGQRPVRRGVSAPGCDDAPVVFVASSADPKPVTIILPYYENPQTLAAHMIRWGDWPATHRKWLSAIIVDDGSPEHPAGRVLAGVRQPFPIRLFRIEQDVRWNWLAARNLAFSHARGWCIVTDIDHIIPPTTMDALLWGEHDPSIIYRFSRREYSGEDIPAHPNSWFMTREMFWRIGGHDEALSGYYGTDGEYRRRAAKTAPIRILSDRLIREEHVRDSSTTRYLRKQPEDQAVQRIVAARGPDWTPKVLSFPWHEVAL
jgi:hypothetical protein